MSRAQRFSKRARFPKRTHQRVAESWYVARRPARALQRAPAQQVSSAATETSRYRLRQGDYVIRGIRTWSIGGPIEPHTEEDRVTPRIVETLGDHDSLL